MSHTLRPLSLAFILLLLLAGCAEASTPTPVPVTEMPTPTATLTSTPTPPERSQRPLLMAHYMPWYQTPDVTGYWGWHWTMNHFNPAQTDENGRPQIASHTMPLTGPYDFDG